jgi:hypothetical protein
MTDYHDFKLKGRAYRHIDRGWCACEVRVHTPAGDSAWRLFWGPVAEGLKRPLTVAVYRDDEDEVLQFNDFETCVWWVDQRGGEPP